MLSPHESLGIALIAFYVPIVPAAIRLMYRNGQIRPRLAWWPLIPFSLSYDLLFPLCSSLPQQQNTKERERHTLIKTLTRDE